MTETTAADAPARDVLINFVLDKSGSMGEPGLPEATKRGVNSFFAEQRALPGMALLSMTLFDTEFDVRYVAIDLREVPDLGTAENPYHPHGWTALYDAVVTTIRGTEAWLAAHPDFDGKVVCVIQTDGAENSSKTATLDQVNALITEKTAEGWEFVFMGAGGAAWTEARRFTSIPAENLVAYASTADATTDSYGAVSRSLSATRTTGAAFTGKG